jgi:uncharacterized membrane protein YgcG
VKPSEQGYVILVAIFFMALLVLALAVAAPQIAKSIQRDRDLETWHRGMQYCRAVQLYYRKFHAYPPDVDALVNTNDIRFLRKRYIDPITGQDDWQPIMFGENKTPTAMGFFGQPLAGNASTLAGVGPSGGAGLPGATNSSGGFSLSPPDSGFGAAQSPSSGTAGPTDNSGASSASTSSTDSSGATGFTGGTSSGGTSSNGASSGSGPSGQTFGGAGIIGFSPSSPKKSILVYKKKNHYNEWEFTYDPLSELKMIGGGTAGGSGQPAGGNGINNSGSGSNNNQIWSPNGNLPAPSPTNNDQIWSPNGNLPAPTSPK